MSKSAVDDIGTPKALAHLQDPCGSVDSRLVSSVLVFLFNEGFVDYCT